MKNIAYRVKKLFYEIAKFTEVLIMENHDRLP